MKLRMLFCILLILAVLLGGCTAKHKKQQDARKEQILIAAGIPPIADFCRRIGGESVSVRLLVPPGASPHTYQPTSEDMRYLAKADMLVLNGIGLEFWANSVVSASGNTKLKVLDLSKAPQISEAIVQDDKHSAHKEHTETGNPHVWLDPQLAKVQVRQICDALCKQVPDKSEYFRENLYRLLGDMDGLDEEISRKLQGVSSRDFISFHPAWTYFAKRYSLNQVASIEEFPGKEPTSEKLRSIIDQCKQRKIKVVVAETQFSTQLAETIAKDAGAKVVVMDPLGSEENWDYIEMMKRATNTLAEALK